MTQLSSFTKKSNADEFVNLVKTKGYSPFVKKEGDEEIWYKVRVGPYPSRQEAGEVARTLKKIISGLLLFYRFPARSW